jgi:hypothetical protein
MINKKKNVKISKKKINICEFCGKPKDCYIEKVSNDRMAVINDVMQRLDYLQ